MVHRAVIPFTAMTGPQPSARTTADPRTVRLALELLERTAGRRRLRTATCLTDSSARIPKLAILSHRQPVVFDTSVAPAFCRNYGNS